MNKVNICMSEQDAVAGFQNITIGQISGLINGSIDDILFKGLDAIPFENRSSTIIEILNKLKHKGTATFEFLDILSLGRDIYNGSANSKYISSLIQNRSSVGFETDIVELVYSVPNLKIKNRYTNGTNIVVVIYKELANG